MMAPEPRNADRTSYYKMKTPGRSQGSPAQSHSHSPARAHSRSNSHNSPSQLNNPPQSHALSNAQSFFVNKSITPMASPKQPYSVGQQHPPKLSPGAGRGATQDARAPSPNYFGLPIETVADPRDSAALPRENWSPATSSVKSFAAAIPKQMPLDANPEFEAFRRQVDANRGRSGFNLSTSQLGIGAGTTAASTPSAAQRPRPPRWHTHASDASDLSIPPRLSLPGPGPPNATWRDHGAVDEPASVSAGAASERRPEADATRIPGSDSKGHLNPPSFLGMGRRESPAQMDSPYGTPRQWSDERRQNLSQVDDRHPRLSMMQGKADPPTPGPVRQHQRADTVPPTLEDAAGPSLLAPAQLKELIEAVPPSELLLLDLRVSPLYGQSRIRGALNLCIPTTLLKRATFNLEKLQQTFQADSDQEKFSNWRNVSHLVVYEAHSSDKRDAVPAMNTIKKFTSEGFSGRAAILRGGFNAFATAYPSLVDRAPTAGGGGGGRMGGGPTLSLAGPGSGSGTSRLNNGRPMVAPVVGGVMLPQSNNSANPFFSNIRQNQDLVDGVGQMDISIPSGLDSDGLPRWLRQAADRSDHGKTVADQFLRIELAEQARMRAAYSVVDPPEAAEPGAAPRSTAKIQLSGLEKGGKNRYKDILPFEHARVRLAGKPEGTCDYVNASHIQASRSHKRYIASQGPLPATFEDFWSVIWDQDVRVIVMLTAESEGGQLKCHPYWQGHEFGSIKLRLLTERKVSLDIDKHRSGSVMSAQSQSQSPSSLHSSSSHGNGQSGSWNPPTAEGGRRRANTTTTLGSNAPGPAATHPAQSQAEAPIVIIRTFALTHTAYPFAPPREITHLHYPSWPDFGAPAQPSHLLALVELANYMQRHAKPPAAMASATGPNTAASASSGASSKRSGAAMPLNAADEPESDPDCRPMLVHCSAGCGRTGTFCTVDSVIDMLKRQRLRAARQAELRVAMREQRVAQQMRMQEKEYELKRGKVDADGDVAMEPRDVIEANALEEAVSPFARSKEPPTYFHSPTSSDDREFPISQSPGAVADGDDLGRIDDSEDGLDTAWLSDEGIDLIARTVEDFRGQRLSMVQSLRQFVLCYETVIEWLWRIQERGSGVGGGGGGGIEGRLRVRTGSLAFLPRGHDK